MRDEPLVNITYDNSPVDLDRPAAAADLSLPTGPVDNDRRIVTVDRSRLLEYCVVASLILHILAFAAIPGLSEWQRPVSRPGPVEPTTPVRLVQLPDSLKKDEPPPEDASAISDRNHTAKEERIPKILPEPRNQPAAKTETSQQKREKPRNPRKPKPPSNRTKAKKDRGAKPMPPIAVLPKTDEIKKWDVNLHPSSQEIKTAFASPGSEGSPDFYPDGEADEIVIDMNTREDRFFSYILKMRQKIESAWAYPESAGRAGIEGALIVEFVIVKDGSLKRLALLKSSGHEMLDQAALCAIRAAAPFHPFPPKVRARQLRIRTSFIYVTNSFVRDANDFIRKFLP